MSADGLRVALLTPCFWPEVRRGGERFVHELATGLAGTGHHPRMITSHRGRLSLDVEDGVEVLRLPRPPGAGRLARRRIEDHLLHVPLSYAALRHWSPDVAHAIFPTDALAAGRWGGKTGRPTVLSFLGIPDHPGLMDRRKRLAIVQRNLRECTVVTALSRTAADAFERWLGYEAPVVYPGVDLHAFTLATERAADPTIFCSADAGEPRKRVGLLVEAFARVRRRRPEARLELSRPKGGPRIMEDIAGAVEGVTWVDVDDRAALAAANGRAWLTALPSIGDAFGLVLVESLACGTPVVGARHGAIPEVVDRPSIGRLFDGADPESLATALLEALELHEDPATPARCRARAEEFSTERTTAAYVDLYRRLGA